MKVERASPVRYPWVPLVGFKTMPNNTAATWSAVAGWFAALIASLAWWIQRRNQLESVRPELVLDGWTRRAQGQGDAAHEVIAFQTIRNVGRGAALHLFLNAAEMAGNRPTAIMSMERLPILAPGETHDINGEITVWWKNVGSVDGKIKHLAISVKIFCLDSRRMRHETRYRLLAVELSPMSIGVVNEIAPGVMLTNRTTVARPVWLLKLFNRLGRAPGLRRLRRKPK